jgi:hypothetical protein
MSSSTRGVIYIVTGKKFVEEACLSAVSVKQCMPDIPITIFSDLPVDSKCFDQVVPIANPTHGPEDKILNIGKSPYRETLYLDSDTHMVDDCSELFSLLERFDLAVVHAPYRTQYRVNGVPECFPEFNTGVMLFRKSDKIGSLFEKWLQNYKEDALRSLTWLFPGGEVLYRHAPPNQPSFRRALYESGLRFAPLPPEYNCRITFPGFVHTKVKIIHGRADCFSTIEKELNRTTLPRVHLMRWGELKIWESAMPPGESILARMRWSTHHLGILQTAKSTIIQFTNAIQKIFAGSDKSGIR